MIFPFLKYNDFLNAKLNAKKINKEKNYFHFYQINKNYFSNIMFPSAFNFAESLSSKLHNPNTTLEDILADDNLIVELKFQNESLLKL